jgi:hypothetical protein
MNGTSYGNWLPRGTEVKKMTGTTVMYVGPVARRPQPDL